MSEKKFEMYLSIPHRRAVTCPAFPGLTSSWAMAVLVISVLDGGPESESASYVVNSKISSIRSENSCIEFQFGFPSFLQTPM